MAGATEITEGRALSVSAGNAVEQAIEHLANAARSSVVFGEPIERGEVTIIPCSEIALGLGTGGGSGTSQATQQAGAATGGGIGGGGGARGRPVATIVISRGTVRVEPIVDATKVALAALTTMGAMAFWLIRLTSATRARPPQLAAMWMRGRRMRGRGMRGRGMRGRIMRGMFMARMPRSFGR